MQIASKSQLTHTSILQLLMKHIFFNITDFTEK